MQLSQGDWNSFFGRLAGQMPQLKSMRLRGKFDQSASNGPTTTVHYFSDSKRHAKTATAERGIHNGESWQKTLEKMDAIADGVGPYQLDTITHSSGYDSDEFDEHNTSDNEAYEDHNDEHEYVSDNAGLLS